MRFLSRFLSRSKRLLLTRFRLVEDAERDSADCWVINTCTVKSPSQSAMSNLILSGRAAGKRMVISGCVPQGDKRLEELEDLSLLGECMHATRPERCGAPDGLIDVS